MNWNLEQLKTELKTNKSLKGWIVTQENTHRRERYFLKDGKGVAVDQDREVHAQSVEVRLFVDIGKAGRQGEITKKLFKEAALKPQIESAIEAAKQTDHQAWDLPKEIPSDLPEVKSCDPRMMEDLNRSMDEVTSEILRATSVSRKTDFNSSELFMSVHHREAHLSNGLTHRTQQSRMYVEAAYSYTENGNSDEYLHTSWTISPKDISVSQIFQEASDRAEHSLNVKKPTSGKYHVILDADVLATLMNGYASHLYAHSEYLSLPFKRPGEEFVAGASGDLLTLRLDPSLEYGAVTVALGDQGVVQKPLVLVDRNKVVATATDKQHGDYLGRKASTYRGNVVVDAGKLSHSQLTQAAPQVLEILQFSGLFFSPNTGTYSSEIRLARLFDNQTGKISYIKGGSLSGSIADNFKFARLSAETTKKAHFDYGGQASGYMGPAYALVSEVSVVG